MGEDPIGFEGGILNLYMYTQNDPINFRDSSGKVSSEILWANRNFIQHYFFGFGQTMNINPQSALGNWSPPCI